MEFARTTAARRLEHAAQTVRWDRVGRVALLVVMLGVLALYVKPTVTWIGTWRESKAKQADVRRLAERNRELKARRAQLSSPGTVEREARRLGMVRPGERPYVVEGLPGTP
jgi:cell division protein FtsB